MANEQQTNEQQTSEKQANSRPKTDQAEAVESVFKLQDLSRLTFRLGGDQELDVWSSTATQFQTYVQQFGTIDNVDTTSWPPFERLDYVNWLWNYCHKNRFRFPFMAKPVNAPVVKDEDVGT
jgi:hypothetical protein